MKDKSGSQHTSKRRGVNITALASHPQRQNNKNISKRKKGKPNSRLQVALAIAPQYRMKLRSSTRDSMHNQDSTIHHGDMTTQLSHASTPALPSLSTIEPVVRASSYMSPGYHFVPKGDPYLTRHCRRRTQLSREVVYAVVDDENKQVGIRVPRSIYATVLQKESATRLSRQETVRKGDERLEERFREAIRKRFPRMPHSELRMAVRHATAKREGRVGRTGRIDMAEKAYLAVQAHIRHKKTNYEDLLRSRINRKEARDSTFQTTSNILREWGPAPSKSQIPKKSIKKIRDGTASLKGVRHQRPQRRPPNKKRGLGT